MALTRITNDQITDATITGVKLVDNTVTSSKLEDNLTYGSDLVVSGNLTVNGTTTTVDTTNTLIADPLFVLSRGETGTPSADSGLVIERGTSTNVAFIWDESADTFAAVNTTEDGSTAGDITIASYADFKAGAMSLESVAIDNINIDGNSITSTDVNGNINLTPNGTGEVVASTIAVSDLTSGRVLLAGASGALEDSGNLTFDGTDLTAASVKVSDLTSGRVLLAGTSGALEDNVNLTFDGTTLTVTGDVEASGDLGGATATITGNATVGGTFGVTGESTLASATISDLTSGRVMLAGTAGAVEDSANLTFDGSELSVTGGVTASGTVEGATVTDGTASLASGSLTGAVNVTASGTVTGGTLTDGTLSANAGTITGGVAATFSGTITGGTLTDGTASFNSGALTGATTGAFSSNVTVGGTLGVTGEATLASATISDLTDGRVMLAGTSGAVEDSANLTFSGTLLDVTGDVTASGTVEGATVTDGVASFNSGALTGATSITASGTITGGTLTDGTASFNSGALSGATTGAFSGAVTMGSTLGVTGEATLASATVSDLTATRITFAGASGSLTDSANLTFDGTNVAVTGGIDVTGDLDVDNININGNAITSTDLNGDIDLTPNGTGEVVASSMSVSDLTDNRIVVAGTAGSLEDDANFTWDGSAMGVTGGVDITGDLDIDNIKIDGNTISSTDTNGDINITPDGTGVTYIKNLNLAGLTADRVLVTNSSGGTTTDDNLTWDGSDLDVTGAMTVDNITIDGDTISSVHSEIIIDPSTAGPGGTVTIAGNLNVTGTTTTVDSTVVTIADPLFQLGADSDDGLDRGITALYNDGAAKTAFFGMDDSAVEFVFIADATDAGSVLSGDLGSAAFGSLRVTDLTSTRVLLAGTSGEIEDSGNLTFDGSTLAVTGAATISTTLGVTGAVTASSTLDVTGLASLDGGIDVDGAFTVADTSGNIATTGTLDVSGLASLDGGIDVDGAFTVADTSGNIATTGTLGVTGESTLASATVSDLTSGRVVLAGTAGAIEDSGNLTFDGAELAVTGDVAATGDLGGATATITGNATVGGTFGATGAATLSSTLDVTGLASLDGGIDVDGAFTVANTSGNVATTGTLNAGETTVSSATVSDLTDGRVVLAGAAGALEDSGNLTFNGSTLTVTGAASVSGNATVGGTLGVTGEATLASATISDVTATHVMFAGTAGAVEGSANLTWSGTLLDVTGGVTASGAVEGGSLTDGTATLASGSITGGVAATFSGAVEGGSLTDGTATLASGSLTGAVNVTASGTITGGTLTDGTASLNAGALSGATTGAFSSNVTVGGTLGVTGEATLASATVSDLTDNRIVIAGLAGSLEDDANLTFDGTTFEVGTAFDVTAANGNTAIGGTLGVTGEATLASATVSDLTSGRVVLAGTAGAIEDSGNFTFDGTTATITGALTVDNVSIDGNSLSSSDNLTIDAAAAGSIVINDAGADVDFRVEGSGEANALFVEGSTGNVGIKTATPAAGADLHINSTSSMIVPVGTTAERPAVAAEGMTRFNTTIDQLEFYNGTDWLVAGAEFTVIVADSFTADGTTTVYTLSENTTTAGAIISINGVVQDPGTSYSISTNSLTFTEAPQSGDNIDARILTTTTTVADADSALQWSNARTITLTGDVSGSVSIDGSADVSMTTVVVNDSHTHDTVEVDGGDTAITLTDTGSDGNIEFKVDNTVIANMTDNGLMPNTDSNGVTGFDLGSPSLKWRDLYLSSGSLYIDGQKVVESDAGTIVVSADQDQSLTTKVSGTGVLTLQSATTISMAGTLQMATGKKITDQGGNAVVFGDKIDADNNQIINVGAPTADGHVTTKGYVDTAIAAIATDAITEGDTEIDIADLGTGTIGFSVDGTQRLALSATSAAFTVPVTYNGNQLATEAYADTAEADARSYTDTRETAITTAYQSYADTAEADAISSANAYTDGRETAITTAYQSYSDVQKARVDAILTASSADKDTFAEIVTFINSVDTTNDTALGTEITTRAAADTALSGRLDTIEGSGTGSVAKAEADAIASAEAKDVVRAAAANAYTDTREAAITTAYQSYADTAEVDAKAYTDTRETAITTAYQAYANTAESDAIASANSYTDTAVASLVDSAPGTLDTLNELAAALGDDASFSTTVTNSIATKLPLAGGTMSGAINMGSQNITNAGTITGTFSGNVTGNVTGSSGSTTGNAATATALETARTIALGGDVSGSTSFDGSGNVTITATVADDSHNHIIGNVDGLQSALNLKAPLASPTFTGTVSGVTASMVGLGNVTNESKATMLSSPALTGTPTAPTAAANTNTTQVATTAYVQQEITDLVGGAPGALDTLNELAAAINDDASYASTTTTALGARLSSSATVTLSGDVTGTANFSGNVATISATIADDSHNHVVGNIDGIAEYIQDTVGSMWSSNTESGVSVTYQDTDGTLDINVNDPTITLSGAVTGSATMTNLGNVSITTTATADPTLTINGDASGSATFTNLGNATLTLTIADDSHNHTTANIDGFTESVQDIAGGMWASNSESGVSVTYQDTDGTLDINVNDPTITLTGDVTGSATMTNLGNVSIAATVAANSVALGTDTTGNYVGAGATSGNGISGSVSSEGGTFTVSSNATSANTASTIVYRDASGNFSAGTITATATTAQYADLAENYTADAAYEPGTVVSFGGDAEVTANGADMDRRVAGVVSTDPAHLMNADCAGEHVVALALQGRVPCKVTGPVAKGDIMVSAGNGMARAEADPKVGTVIGKALEAHEGGEGVIEVAVGRF